MNIEALIFYLLLVDSISCNVIVWFGEKWYTKHFRIFSRWFPPAPGWALYYLALVLWAGSLLYRAHMLPW